MKKLSLHEMIRQSVIAALYVVLTLSLGNAGYGEIQFRISEFLNLLAFFNPINAIGVTLGVLISNFWSPFGVIDMIFGTIHTIIALFFIAKSKNLLIASIWPAVFSFIIGFELTVLAGQSSLFFLTTLYVMISELIIMSIISVPLYTILSKNSEFMKVIGLKYNLYKKYLYNKFYVITKE